MDDVELAQHLGLRSIYELGTRFQLVGLMYACNEQGFIAMLPGEAYPAFAMPVSSLSLQAWNRVLEQTDNLDVEVTAPDADGKLVKAFVRKSQRQIDASVSWRVFKRDKYSCRYCGNDNIPLTVDHLVRWENGGPSTEANLVAACRKCNRTRGDTEYGDWLRDPYYEKVARKLSQEEREANIRLLSTLSGIPRVAVVRSR